MVKLLLIRLTNEKPLLLSIRTVCRIFCLFFTRICLLIEDIRKHNKFNGICCCNLYLIEPIFVEFVRRGPNEVVMLLNRVSKIVINEYVNFNFCLDDFNIC